MTRSRSQDELIAVLCRDGLPIENSFVIDGMLHRIDARGVVYFDILEEDPLLLACVELVTSLGLVYDNTDDAELAWRERQSKT